MSAPLIILSWRCKAPEQVVHGQILLIESQSPRPGWQDIRGRLIPVSQSFPTIIHSLQSSLTTFPELSYQVNYITTDFSPTTLFPSSIIYARLHPCHSTWFTGYPSFFASVESVPKSTFNMTLTTIYNTELSVQSTCQVKSHQRPSSLTRSFLLQLPNHLITKWSITYHDREAVAPGYWFTAPYWLHDGDRETNQWIPYQIGPHIFDQDGVRTHPPLKQQWKLRIPN